MPESNIPTQIVLFTQQHSIMGGVFLKEQRLSDLLNDLRDKNIRLRNASVARLADPAKILVKTQFSLVPKSGVLLAFEPPQAGPTSPRRFIRYPKQKYPVFILMDGIEVRGDVHVQGALDLMVLMAGTGESFLPLTQATVTFEAHPGSLLRREAVIVNIQRIRFIGEIKDRPKTEPTS